MSTLSLICAIVIYALSFPIMKRLFILGCKYNKRIYKLKGHYYNHQMITENGNYNKSNEADYHFFRMFTIIPILQQFTLLIALIAYIVYFISYINIRTQHKLKESNTNLYLFGLDTKKILKFISSFSTFKPQ